nr:homoserine kinase [Motilibacter aurantiacus]
MQVPATSANLGPGFDAFGLAVGLHDEVTVQALETGVQVQVEGEGAVDVPRDERHLIVRAMAETFDAMGVRMPGVALTCVNRIPHGRGLGSSSAAIVAGVLAARALVTDGSDRLPDAAALEVAARLEGHPDNVAPCLLGGFTVAWQEHGRSRAVRLEPVEGLAAVAYVPSEPVATEYARSLLPAAVPHPDAARNAGRAALLVHALTADPGLLLTATEDRLHQGYREPAMPRSAALVARLRSAGVPAVISGAGPTVLALVPPSAAAALAAEGEPGFRALVLPLERQGARVRHDGR